MRGEKSCIRQLKSVLEKAAGAALLQLHQPKSAIQFSAIHPVAAKIAELTGGEAVDGWKTTLPDDEIMVAVVDCGGTVRCGVYPKKGINTVNLMPVGKAGPLANFITEDNYVSAVREKNIEAIDDDLLTENIQ